MHDALTEKLLYHSKFIFDNLFERKIDARSSKLLFCVEHLQLILTVAAWHTLMAVIVSSWCDTS